jgi:hypothetical protein
MQAVTPVHYSLLMEGMLAQEVDRWQLQLMIASITPGPLEYHCAETLLTLITLAPNIDIAL